MRRRRAAVLTAWVTLLGCGTSESAPTTRPEPTGAELVPVTPTAAEGARSEPEQNAERPATADAEAPPVDLLRAVRTDLAVSSAYRDETSQAGHLVDGNLETAWNSRSGDLVGAWIEARIPASATVTSIALTAGFTKVGEGTDLFTGNHRVARVRVLRDGQEIAVRPLDPESRALQILDIMGPGGVYRIEVAEVVPGSRSTWRETCISELRILGRDAGARDGARFPRFAVGQLPEPRPAPGSHDRAEVARRLREDAQWVARAWKQLERDVQRIDQNTGEPGGYPEERAALARARRTLLHRAADLVELVDDVQADALRQAASTDVAWSDWRERASALRADLDKLAPAIGAVVAWLADDESRCAWAKADVALRLARIAHRLETARYFNEVNESMEGGPSSREERQRWNAIERGAGTFASVERSWSGNPEAAAARLRDLTLPEELSLTADWDAVRAELEVARTSCGWGG